MPNGRCAVRRKPTPIRGSWGLKRRLRVKQPDLASSRRTVSVANAERCQACAGDNCLHIRYPRFPTQPREFSELQQSRPRVSRSARDSTTDQDVRYFRRNIRLRAAKACVDEVVKEGGTGIYPRASKDSKCVRPICHGMYSPRMQVVRSPPFL